MRVWVKMGQDMRQYLCARLANCQPFEDGVGARAIGELSQMYAGGRSTRRLDNAEAK